MSEPDPNADRILPCPGCGEQICIPAGTLEPTATCPYCSALISVETGRAVDIEDESSDESAPEPSDELDGMRIRQIAAMKRSTYRARSYAIIAAFTCIVVAGQLAWMSIQRLSQIGLDQWSILYIVLVPLCAWGAFRLHRIAHRLHEEAAKSGIQAPTESPDFSELSTRDRSF